MVNSTFKLEVHALVDGMVHGDEALYNLRNFNNKIQAIKDISAWNAAIRMFEKCNNIKVMDTILSCKSIEELEYMKNIMMADKSYSDGQKLFLAKAFIIALYQFFQCPNGGHKK